MVKLTIDNRVVEVDEGTTIMQAADQLGIQIPRFCYHPRLSIPGNCRICIVDVKGSALPAISCKELVREGMIVRTNTDEIRRARADILEFILINHPLDCPVCDAAGKCDLQDIYFEHSQRPSRSLEPKVKKPKAKRIGPNIMLDAERCIKCTRCVRFCEEILKRHELGLYDKGDRTEIGIAKDNTFSSPYSLCAVDLCPVGALTSIDFRFKKRAWFLKSAPSICAGCATACSVWLDHAGGVAYRIRPREDEDINKSWMCDDGRMTYKVLGRTKRFISPSVLIDSEQTSVSWEDALRRFSEIKEHKKTSEVVCALSAQASLEENLAIFRLARESLGADKVIFSGAAHEPGFADDMLRNADRNPNTRGVRLITDLEVHKLPRGCGIIVLEGLRPDHLIALVEAQAAWVVLITSSIQAAGRWADVVFPRATHFEQDGTFVDANGRLREFKAGINPMGQSEPAWKIAGLIAQKFGKSWDMNSAQECIRWGIEKFQIPSTKFQT
ncbi:MAG: 2Fe-2S iron-sulfur cluster-binding protein [Pseudomonadota bacterium]